tara:strand:- start:89231 stop:89353 length:123 start_codon:yes stop_codon:yes gene_type:complete
MIAGRREYWLKTEKPDLGIAGPNTRPVFVTQQFDRFKLLL